MVGFGQDRLAPIARRIRQHTLRRGRARGPF